MPPRDVQGAKAAPRRPRRGNSVSAIAHAVAQAAPHPAPAPGAQHRPVSQSPVFGPLHAADQPIHQALRQATQSVQQAKGREPSPAPTPGQQDVFRHVAGTIPQTIHAQHLVAPHDDPVIRADLGSEAQAAHNNKPFDAQKVMRAIELGLPSAQNLANINGTIWRRDNRDKGLMQHVLGLGGTPVPLDPVNGGIQLHSSDHVRAEQASAAASADPVKSSALFSLNQVTRPLHGVETGLDAAVTGKDPLAGAAKGFLHTNQAVIGSGLLRHLGVHNKALAAIGGFGVDVGLDPATYLSGGASIPAKEAARTAAEEAARIASEEAVSQGPRAAAQAESAAYQRAYEEAFAAHPGKARGISVGGRVHIPLTNVTLQGKTPAFGSTVFAGARHRIGEAAREGGTKKTAAPSLVTRAAAHVTPQMRPPGFTDAQWETLRQASRVFRGNTNARERAAMETAHGLHRALGPGENPSFVAGMETAGPLTREQQALHETLNQTGEQLLARGAISGRIGGGAPPHVPEVTANPQATREALDAAIRERARQELMHQNSLAGFGVARGRAQVLSRNVAGSVGERRAQAMTVPAGVPQFAEGGHGVEEAARGLMASSGNLAAARKAVQDAATRHDAELALAAEQRTAQRVAQRELDRFNTSAQRFYPHTATSELEPKGARLPGRPGGASASSFTSGRHRRYVEPIHLQTNSAAEHFSTNVPAVAGHYLTKAGRRIESSDYWNRVAGLGKVLTRGTEADLKPGEMVYRVDTEGLHPIESKLEPGTVNEAKVRRALARAKEPSDPADKFVVLPSHLVEQAKTMVQRGSGSEHAFTRAYDALLGQTKAFQTIRNPAYQLTNLSGDVFMARQGGATTRDFLDARKVSQESHAESAHRSSAAAAQGEPRAASDATVTIKGKKVPVSEVVRRFREQGLQEGHVVDIQDVLGHQLKATRLRRFNTARELYPRYATFISALKRGMSDQAAARHVVEHHFDYSDLTPAERGLRRVIPFYTFARRNAGLQARKLVTNPRVQAHFQEAREEAAASQGEPKNWEDTLRGYERQGLPFPLPDGLRLFTRMPVTDLNQLTLSPKTALRNVTTRTAPLITLPYELAGNRDFFFNQPINPNDPATNRVQAGAKGLVPAPNIPGLTPLLAKMGVVHPIQNPHGKGMVPGWSPYVPFILRSLPQTNYAQQITTNSPGTNHGVSSGLAVLNLLSGLKVAQAKPEQEAYTQALTYANLLQSRINEAQQRGETARVAELKHELSALSKALPQLRKAAGYPVRGRTRRGRAGSQVILGGGAGAGGPKVMLGGGSTAGGSKVILGGG